MKKVKRTKRKQASHKRIQVSTKLSTKHFSLIFAGALVVAIGVVGYITNQSTSQGYASLMAPGGGSRADYNCIVAKGYCSNLGKGCGANGGKFRMDRSDKYSCGKNTVCCLPQPPCSSIRGAVCRPYGYYSVGSGYNSNSTYPGCKSGTVCYIPAK